MPVHSELVIHSDWHDGNVEDDPGRPPGTFLLGCRVHVVGLQGTFSETSTFSYNVSYNVVNCVVI